MKRLVLIDGNALLHRAFHVTPPLTTSQGELVNGVYGFTAMLLKVIDGLKPDYLAVAWDMKAPTFRHSHFENYKANRGPADETLSAQYPRVFEVTKAFNIPEYKLPGFEADDLVGTLAKQAQTRQKNLDIIIVTGDRDLMQLINNRIKVLMPKKTLLDVGLYGEEEFSLRYGFEPKQLVDFKALAGDSSDNIPGVSGIGEVSATKLIQKYGSLDKIYTNLKELPERMQQLLTEGKESAYLSQKLATIETEIPIKLDLADCRTHDFDQQKVVELFSELEFKSLIPRIPGYSDSSSKSRLGDRVDLNNGSTSSQASSNDDSSNLGSLTTDLDHKLEPVLKKMSKTGVLIDWDFLEKMGKDLKDKLGNLEKDTFHLVGHEFNINSPKQLQEILFDQLNLPVVKKTKTGRSTDEETLQQLSTAHPIIPLLLQYRQLFKLVSTYIDALPRFVGEDGRVHSTFNVEGAATGRLSCVPINSDILTKSGWKSYKELEIGELVLGYDIIKDHYYWTKLKDIHRGKDQIGLLQINRGHDKAFRRGIWCTGEHRWVVKNDKVIGFSQVKNIPRTYKTILMPKSTFPETSDSLITELESFLLGWYLTDGFLTGKKTVGLGINVVKMRSVDLLEEQFITLTYSKKRYKLKYDKSHYVTAFHISSKIFDRIYRIYERTKPSVLVLSLSNRARESMLSAMLEGDGSMRRNRKYYDRFGALKIQNKKTCEIFELLCVSLGRPYKTREIRLPKSDKIFVEYTLLQDELSSNKNSDWKAERTEEVWCPETECGTWVMRQENQIAVTGNSQNPNLQNIPIKGELGSEIRKAFIAPKGKILVGVDYSQIELRILAHLSQDPGLIKAFSQGLDIHAATASRIFKIPIDQVNKAQRMVGKTMNFATLYGQGPHALSRQLGVDYDVAKSYIEEYFAQFPKVKDWIQQVLEQGYKNGYVETIWGRKRYIPELQSTNRMMRAFGERAAANHPTQGSSADMIKKAMVEIDKKLDKECQMILQVHDELLFECKADGVKQLAKIVKQEMENALALSVPVKVEVKVGPNWAEMKPLGV